MEQTPGPGENRRSAGVQSRLQEQPAPVAGETEKAFRLSERQLETRESFQTFRETIGDNLSQSAAPWQLRLEFCWHSSAHLHRPLCQKHLFLVLSQGAVPFPFSLVVVSSYSQLPAFRASHGRSGTHDWPFHAQRSWCRNRMHMAMPLWPAQASIDLIGTA